MEPSDSILVTRWRQGDAQAAAQVVARYGNALGAVAYGVLHNTSQAEEAVQEAFARAAGRMDTLNGRDRLGPWLVGIVRHVALDMARRRWREVPYDGHDAPATTTPEGDAQRHELRTRLRDALEALPEDQRELFTMKYVGGLSYAAMAHATGSTPEAVGQKLWRIRQRLQRELEEFRP